ncbi:hypothetical protein ACX0G7_02730 [Flavitalea antarctica]
MKQSINTKISNRQGRLVQINYVTLLLLFIALFATTFNTACRKDNRIERQVSDTALQLINSGYYWDQTSQVYHACYWLDGKFHELPEPGGKGAYAYGIDAKDRNIYIAGSYESEDGSRLFPAYWKNGRKVDLPYTTFGPFEKCGAKDLVIWDGKIYISGAVDLRPVLWIVTEGGHITQRFIDNTEGVRSASNILLHNNKLFIGGDKANRDGNGYHFEVGYWTIDANGESTWHRTETNLKYATAFSIAISSDKIFIAGERNVLNGRGTDSYMNLWNGSGKLDLQPIDEMAAYRLNEIVPMGNGNMLLNAYDFKTHRPLIFKINENGQVLELLRPEIPQGVRGYCTDVAYKNGKLAYGGFYSSGSTNHLWVKADNRNFELETPNGAQATANRSKWILK